MPIETIRHEGQTYPAFQADGNAARFAIPYAKQVCKGVGIDIGNGKHDWSFPGAFGIDKTIDPSLDALELPPYAKNLDYVFSSHCLEHLPDWSKALDHWTGRLRSGGVLFLYLPHYSQTYWRAWNHPSHLHSFRRSMIRDYLFNRGFTNIFVSGVDLNNSFMAMGEKA